MMFKILNYGLINSTAYNSINLHFGYSISSTLGKLKMNFMPRETIEVQTDNGNISTKGDSK